MEQQDEYRISMEFYRLHFQIDDIRRDVAKLIPMDNFEVTDLLRWIFKELSEIIATDGHARANSNKNYLRNNLENLEQFENWMLCFGIMFERFENFIEGDVSFSMQEFWKVSELCIEVDY